MNVGVRRPPYIYRQANSNSWCRWPEAKSSCCRSMHNPLKFPVNGKERITASFIDTGELGPLGHIKGLHRAAVGDGEGLRWSLGGREAHLSTLSADWMGKKRRCRWIFNFWRPKKRKRLVSVERGGATADDLFDAGDEQGVRCMNWRGRQFLFSSPS